MRKFFSIILMLLMVMLLSSCGRLKDNGDGTVIDRETGLTWQQDEGGRMNFVDAQKYCGKIVLGDLSDWRLPTISIIELSTLIDRRAHTPPRINLSYFPKTKSTFYMTSSTTKRKALISGWEPNTDPEEEVVRLVSFGSTNNYPIQNDAFVRCVSGEMKQK